MRPERIGGFSILYVIVALLAVWTLVLTIIFARLYIHDRGHVCDIKEIRNDIQENIDNTVQECCGNIEDNCTCQGIEPEFLCWDAASNIPELISGTGNESQEYVTCTAGDTLLDGTDFWARGDYARFTSDTNTWFKNEAEGAGTIPRETYNVTFVLTSSFVLARPFNTTTQVDIFLIGNGYAIFHMAAFAVSGSSNVRCPPLSGDVPCGYVLTDIEGLGQIPLNRAPVENLNKYIWTDSRACISNSNVTDQCGDTCGNASAITNNDAQIGRLTTLEFQTDGDLIIDYGNNANGCHQVRQAYFMYRLAQV